MKTEREPIAGIIALPAFPVVLVTVDRNIMTAAAFSFYSFKPPCVMVGIMPENLTFSLLSERREFGVNLPHRDQLDIVRMCGSVSGRDEDKYAKAGLTPEKGSVIGCYLISECPVNMECQVVHEVKFGGTHRWFVGEIQAVRIDEDYKRDDMLMYWPRQYRGVGVVLFEVQSI